MGGYRYLPECGFQERAAHPRARVTRGERGARVAELVGGFQSVGAALGFERGRGARQPPQRAGPVARGQAFERREHAQRARRRESSRFRRGPAARLVRVSREHGVGERAGGGDARSVSSRRVQASRGALRALRASRGEARGSSRGVQNSRARARDGGVRGEREAPRRGLARAQGHGAPARGGGALRGRRRLQRPQRGARLRGAKGVAPQQRLCECVRRFPARFRFLLAAAPLSLSLEGAAEARVRGVCRDPHARQAPRAAQRGGEPERARGVRRRVLRRGGGGLRGPGHRQRRGGGGHSRRRLRARDGDAGRERDVEQRTRGGQARDAQVAALAGWAFFFARV